MDDKTVTHEPSVEGLPLEPLLGRALTRGVILAGSLGAGATAVAFARGLSSPVVALHGYIGLLIGLGAMPFVVIERRCQRTRHVVLLNFLVAHVLISVTALQALYAWGTLPGGSIREGLSALAAVWEGSLLFPTAITSTERIVVAGVAVALWALPAGAIGLARSRGLRLIWQLLLGSLASGLGTAAFAPVFDDLWIGAGLVLGWPFLVLSYELSAVVECRIRGPLALSGHPTEQYAALWRGKLLGLIGVLLLGLALWETRAWLRTRHEEQAVYDDRRAATVRLVEAIANRLRTAPLGRRERQSIIRVTQRGKSPPLEAIEEVNGVGANATLEVRTIWRAKAFVGVNNGAVIDWFGRAIYYQCPGPVHKNGWDLISCGPNGIYEEGQGDDIVVGEDLPGGLASIASGQAASVTTSGK